MPKAIGASLIIKLLIAVFYRVVFFCSITFSVFSGFCFFFKSAPAVILSLMLLGVDHGGKKKFSPLFLN
jgi:hypothetical protein